tara:strand:+ start:760 stop:945 length:186 start_codon:yes stop_codon:yes gene_type:complete
MAHRMNEIKPEHVITKKECQEMIDAAMRKHNRNASLISIGLGTIALVGYADGMIRIIERIQ